MTTRVAVVFPGQGAQDVGMGRDLFSQKDSFTLELAQRASEQCGLDVERLCTKGPSRKLEDTRYLQPAMAVVTLGLWNRAVEAGLSAHLVAGHSLGELTALVAAGMITAPEAIDIAVVRGRLMADAAAQKKGSMLAVTGCPMTLLQQKLADLAMKGDVAIAAHNGPDQFTVSGDASLIESLREDLGGESAIQISKLRVSGAWHSPHMESAKEGFFEALRSCDLKLPSSKDNRPQMLFNRHGLRAKDAEEVVVLIGNQLTLPIRFDLLISQLKKEQVTDYIEIGPGKVIRGLLRLNSMDETLRVHGISDLRSLERTIEAVAKN